VNSRVTTCETNTWPGISWSQKLCKSEISIDTGVKRNFWPIIVCQLFCFSE